VRPTKYMYINREREPRVRNTLVPRITSVLALMCPQLYTVHEQCRTSYGNMFPYIEKRMTHTHSRTADFQCNCVLRFISPRTNAQVKNAWSFNSIPLTHIHGVMFTIEEILPPFSETSKNRQLQTYNSQA